MNKEAIISHIREVMERYDVKEQGFDAKEFNSKEDEREDITRSQLSRNNDTTVKSCMNIAYDISNKIRPFRSKMNNYQEMVFNNAVIEEGEFITDQFYKVTFEGTIIRGVFVNCHFDQTTFEKTNFINSAFVNCQFDNTLSVKSVYKNTLFVGCSYLDLKNDDYDNDFTQALEVPFTDIFEDGFEKKTIHNSADMDEKKAEKALALIHEHAKEGKPTKEELADMFEDEESYNAEKGFSFNSYEQTTIDEFQEEEEEQARPETTEETIDEENIETEPEQEEKKEINLTEDKEEGEEIMETLNEEKSFEGKTFTELDAGMSLEDKEFTDCEFDGVTFRRILPTGVPFAKCTFKNVVFDVAINNMQFTGCRFENVLFKKFVKNVLFENSDITFSTEQNRDVFTACSYIMADEAKKNKEAEEMICGKPKVKEYTEEEKQAMIKDEVEKNLEEAKNTAYEEGFKEGKETAENENDNPAEDLVETLKGLAEFTNGLVEKADKLVEKEKQTRKPKVEYRPKELTEEEIKKITIKYLHAHLTDFGNLFNEAQNYTEEESTEAEEKDSLVTESEESPETFL